MDCPLGTRDQAELLVAYSSGRLDAGKAAWVERHLTACEACREVVRGQQALWKALDLWEPERISADFNRRLYQRIEAKAAWWERLLGPLRPLAMHRGIPLAAAACMMLAAGLMLDRTAAPPAPAPVKAAQVASIDGLQPEQVVKALDEMEELSRFDRLMRPETPESKM